jgi:hypothetical protein
VLFLDHGETLKIQLGAPSRRGPDSSLVLGGVARSGELSFLLCSIILVALIPLTFRPLLS